MSKDARVADQTGHVRGSESRLLRTLKRDTVAQVGGAAMRSSILALLGVTTIGVALLQGQSTKQGEVPKVLLTSRHVYVEAIDGDLWNSNILLENRKAIINLQSALQDWKRYNITAKRRDAELVFVVGKGNLASQKRGVGTHERTRANANLDAQLGILDDRLDVYILKPDESLMGPIWRHSLKDGLEPPEMPLFAQFKQAVDTASNQTASRKQNH